MSSTTIFDKIEVLAHLNEGKNSEYYLIKTRNPENDSVIYWKIEKIGERIGEK